MILALASFTGTELTAMIVAVGALITAIGTVWVNIITARSVAEKVTHSIDKIDEISAKSDVIAGHVNSAATGQTVKIEALQSEVTRLTANLADQKQAAALLAQSASNGVAITASKI
jgi:hypothetical protein